VTSWIPTDTLLLFVGSSLALLVAPGPAILYVVAESFRGGRRAGVVASFGLTAGILVHVAAATLGLSALLAASAVLFGIVKYAGAAYLSWLGVDYLRKRRRAEKRGGDGRAREAPPARAVGDGRFFRRGFVINTLNPKVAVFFLAFFPQFASPLRGDLTLQLLALGLLFALLTLAVDVAYAVTAGTAADAVRRRFGTEPGGRLARWGGYTPGLVYLGLGLAAALAPIERR
jgi:threonine/homoserine/homoserine lactone efflux protein